MKPEPLRVLIVDDSRIFRSALEEAMRGQPGVRVVGSVWSGEKALEFIRATPPELVTLDINMPGLGGLETLAAIRQMDAARPDRPPIGVILLSALTERGAAVTVEGLERGAFDFIRKPDGTDDQANAAKLRQELFEKINLFLERRSRSTASPPPRPARPSSSPTSSSMTLPVVRAGRFQAVAIGSSTGGPEALARLLPVVTAGATVPLFIVQHLPQGMTRYFADSLQRRCGSPVMEAEDGAIVQPGAAYVAPGGRHMVLRRQGPNVVIALNDQPPENGCRPSVDVFFRSAAEAYPGAVLAIVLTGMGTDGARSLGMLHRGGAYIIAQDEASSIVWGMPGAAVATNLVDQVLPLEEIGPTAARLLGNGPPR